MLHHNNGMPLLHKGIESQKQFLYIVEMESCSRLIKNEQCRSGQSSLAATLLAEELGKLHPLALTAAQAAAALSKLHITQTHVIQNLQFLGNLFGSRILLRAKEGNCLLNTHIQHLIYGFPLILHIQDGRLEPLSATLLTHHLNIRHKLHRNGNVTLSQTLRTPSAINIE